MAKSGTTNSTASKMTSGSKSGVKHGPGVKNVQSTASRKGVMGSGMTSGKMAPIRGRDGGGLK